MPSASPTNANFSCTNRERCIVGPLELMLTAAPPDVKTARNQQYEPPLHCCKCHTSSFCEQCRVRTIRIQCRALALLERNEGCENYRWLLDALQHDLKLATSQHTMRTLVDNPTMQTCKYLNCTHFFMWDGLPDVDCYHTRVKEQRRKAHAREQRSQL